MRRYAEIVRERAVLRKLVAASDEIATSAFNPQGRPVSQILDEAEGKIFHIGEEGLEVAPGFSEHGHAGRAADRPRQRAARERRRGSDRRAHRLLRPRPHDLRPAARRPDRARGAAVDGQDRARAEHRRARRRQAKACRWSCSRWKWAPRSSRCAWSARSAASTRATCAPASSRDDEWGRLSEAVEKLGKVSLFIDESPALTPSEVRARARRQARQCGQLGLIVVDYLQLMSGSAGGSDENRAHRDRRDLARPEVARQGAEVPGDRAVAAQPQRRDAAPTSDR